MDKFLFIHDLAIMRSMIKDFFPGQVDAVDPLNFEGDLSEYKFVLIQGSVLVSSFCDLAKKSEIPVLLVSGGLPSEYAEYAKNLGCVFVPQSILGNVSKTKRFLDHFLNSK